MKHFIRRKLASLILWLAQPFLLEFSWQVAKHFAERDRATESLTAESHEIDALFVRSIKRLDARVSKLENNWTETVARYIREGRTVSGGCGASDEQKDIGQQQTAFMQQMMGQAQEIFGNSSSVFKDLVNTFAPTVAAGPNQRGFSLPEEAALKSQAITQTGQAYKNASQAVKEAFLSPFWHVSVATIHWLPLLSPSSFFGFLKELRAREFMSKPGDYTLVIRYEGIMTNDLVPKPRFPLPYWTREDKPLVNRLHISITP
jgi:hypothetical protein